jgi:hypothetical protein
MTYISNHRTYNLANLLLRIILVKETIVNLSSNSEISQFQQRNVAVFSSEAFGLGLERVLAVLFRECKQRRLRIRLVGDLWQEYALEGFVVERTSPPVWPLVNAGAKPMHLLAAGTP